MTPSSIALKGQSLAEYTLVGGLLALVSVGGLIALNTTTDQQFITMQGRFGGGGGQQAGPAQNNAAPAANGQAAVAEVSTAASSYPMTLAGYQQMLAELPELIETSGASGATRQMASFLEAAILQAQEAGEIDEQQAQSLLALANKGHMLGKMQEAISTTIDNMDGSKTIRDVMDTSVAIDGRSYSLEGMLIDVDPLLNEIYEQQGLGSNAAMSTLGNSLDSVYQSVATHGNIRSTRPGTSFLVSYVEMKQAGDIPASLAPLVENLATGIVGLSEQYSQTYKNFYYESNFNHTVNEVKGFAKYEGKEAGLKTAVETHVKSKGICTTGKGQDSGTFCSG